MEFTKSYILIDTTHIVQKQYFFDDLPKAKCSFIEHILYDNNILKQYDISNVEKNNNKYQLYQVIHTENFVLPLIQYVYNSKSMTFNEKKMEDDDRYDFKETSVCHNLKSSEPEKSQIIPQDVLQWADEILKEHAENPITTLEYNKLKQFGVSDNATDIDDANENKSVISNTYVMSEHDNDEDNIYNISVSDNIKSDENDETNKIKQKYDDVKKLWQTKIDRLNQQKEICKKIQENAADIHCNVALAKTDERYEKEKLEERKRKFESDKKSYRMIKADLNTGKIHEIPPIFNEIYTVLKTLEENNELDKEDDFDKFMQLYKKLIPTPADELLKIGKATDPYGIFS